MFFTASDVSHGTELWKSNGTAVGTVLVKDIIAGASGSSPTNLTAVGNTLYFVTNDGIHGNELWKSNGTTSGTVLVKDIIAGVTGSSPKYLTAVGNTLYFVASDGTHGDELWKSNGTTSGTVLVKDTCPGTYGSFPDKLIAVGSLVYFSASNGLNGHELWKSDGTANGTLMVKDINAGAADSLSYYTEIGAVGSTLYFGATDGISGTELWKSDGTTTGTVPVKDIETGSGSATPRELTVVGNSLYFLAYQSTTGTELWKSDGTATGTKLVKDIEPGASSGTSDLTAVGNTLFFVALSGHELWKSDGTEGGTVLVKSFGVGSFSSTWLTAAGSTLYFRGYDTVHGYELWKSDGTAAGTGVVKNVAVTDAGSPADLAALGSAVFYSVDNGTNGRELWKSDGTEAGTILLKDLNSGTRGSSPASLTTVGDLLFFAADNGLHGTELWKSDGTAAGTTMVKDIFSGANGSLPSNLIAVGSILYFVADDGVNGRELWKSDGTAAGTQLVKDIWSGSSSGKPSFILALNGMIFFQANDGNTGIELWKSDGTENGTVLFKDCVPGSGDSSPHSLAVVGSSLYFVARNSDNTGNLWKSDGTSAGTEPVKVFPGNALGNLTAFGDALYFVHGSSLWKSDGTLAGTVSLKTYGGLNSYVGKLTAATNLLYFVTDQFSEGQRLWKSDGTAAGTVLVNTLETAYVRPEISQLVAANDILYFSANYNYSGTELWKTDGTEAGTLLVNDCNAGIGSSLPINLALVGDILYFQAYHPAYGYELWKSDGTAAGTVLASHIVDGKDSSSPAKFRLVNHRLYFTATTKAYGEELWHVVVGPYVASSGATNIGYSTATLLGSVNPNGSAATVQLEYGLTASYDHAVPVPLAPNSGSTIQSFQMELSDLRAGRTYHYRLSASNKDGVLATTDAIFTTLSLPQIQVSGNGVIIANNDNTPVLADHTVFGSADTTSAALERTFTIRNVGNLTLNLTGTPRVEVTGDHASDFTVIADPAASIIEDDSTQFSIAFDPSRAGRRKASVRIVCDDLEKTPFTFAISAYGRADTQHTQAITFTAPDTLYLGQSPFILSSYASSGLPVTLSIISGPATVEGNLLTLAGSGTVKVQASQSGSPNYMPAKPVVHTITVKENPATLTLIHLNQTYDGSPKSVSILGATGLITYKIGTEYLPTAPTKVGSYPVKAVVGSLTKTGTLVISKAPLYITPDDQRKFAGQVNPELTFAYSGFVNGETEVVVTKHPVCATTAKSTSPGGLYPIRSSGGTAANYVFVYRQGSLVVESFAGMYEALLMDSTLLPVGRLDLTVAATSKAFTGKVSCATETSALPISGTLTTDSINELATATATVTRLGIPYTASVTLPLNGDVQATLGRNAVALGNAVNGRKLSTKPVTYNGSHTAVLEPGLPASSAVPLGAGWATGSIDTKGVLTLKGRLGDNTAFTSVLKPDEASTPEYRLFIQPYIKARTESFVAGAFALATHPSITNRRYLEQATLTWKKTGLETDMSYRTGFGPVTVVLTIDPWLKPGAATNTLPAVTLAQRLGLLASEFSVAHSATGNESDGNLPTNLGLNPINTIRVLSPVGNFAKWKSTLDATYGTFTGSFELVDGSQKRLVTLSGVLRQPATAQDTVIGDGHFLLPPLSGTEKTTGEVQFTRP